MKYEASIKYEEDESDLRSPPNSGIHIEPSYRCSQKCIANNTDLQDWEFSWFISDLGSTQVIPHALSPGLC